MKTVIVTGAAGFAGCNLTEKLIEKGYEVIAILRPNSRHNERMEPLMNSGRLRTLNLDINEIRWLPRLVRGASPDTFFHLAWAGERDDFSSQYKNVGDTVNALETAAAMGCTRFICTGSQAEYGITDKIQTEDMALNPFSAYGAAKTAAMYLTKRRAAQLGLDWIWGRIFSLYGKYEPEHTLIQYLIRGVKNGEEPHVTSASQNWDYLDAGDAAEALIALGEKGRNGEIYNIANGDYRPLREFIEILVEKSISEAPVGLHNSFEAIDNGNPAATRPTVHYDKTAEHVVSLQPSIEKIKLDTGWSPMTPFGTNL